MPTLLLLAHAEAASTLQPATAPRRPPRRRRPPAVSPTATTPTPQARRIDGVRERTFADHEEEGLHGGGMVGSVDVEFHEEIVRLGGALRCGTTRHGPPWRRGRGGKTKVAGEAWEGERRRGRSGGRGARRRRWGEPGGEGLEERKQQEGAENGDRRSEWPRRRCSAGRFLRAMVSRAATLTPSERAAPLDDGRAFSPTSWQGLQVDAGVGGDVEGDGWLRAGEQGSGFAGTGRDDADGLASDRLTARWHGGDGWIFHNLAILKNLLFHR